EAGLRRAGPSSDRRLGRRQNPPNRGAAAGPRRTSGSRRVRRRGACGGRARGARMTVEATPSYAGAAGEPDLSRREMLEILAVLLTALFTGIISTTIVSNARPTIIGDLQGSQTQYTWVVTISLLAMTVSTPIWAKLSDLFNKKVLVQLAIIVFVI